MGKSLQLRYWGSGACYTLMHTRGLFRLGDKGWAPKLYALYNASHSHFSVIQDQRVAILRDLCVDISDQF